MPGGSRCFSSLCCRCHLTSKSQERDHEAYNDVPEFQVERLDRLMIRMISSELAGKRLAPKEVIAIERGQLKPSEPPTLEQRGTRGHSSLSSG